MSRPPHERRSAKRPEGGQRKPCPQCDEMMRFFERYRVQHGANQKAEPAWVCPRGHEQYVRQRPTT